MTSISSLHSLDSVPHASQPLTAHSETPTAQAADQLSLSKEGIAQFVPSKPILPPPNRPSRGTLAEFAVLRSIDKQNRVGQSIMEMNMESLDDCNEKFKQIEADMAAKLEKAALRTQQSKVWSLLKKIGGVVLAAVSTVLGISLLAGGGGTLIGGLMIASGILTIANLAFSETGVWNWVAKKLAHDNEEKEKKLKIILPAALSVICAVAGLGGSAGALIWTGLNFSQKTLVILQTALSLFEAMLSLGEGAARYETLKGQAELNPIKKELFANKNLIEKLTGDLEKYLRHLNNVLEQAKKIIKLTSNANTKTVIQG